MGVRTASTRNTARGAFCISPSLYGTAALRAPGCAEPVSAPRPPALTWRADRLFWRPIMADETKSKETKTAAAPKAATAKPAKAPKAAKPAAAAKPATAKASAEPAAPAGEPCRVGKCQQPARAKGYCRKHFIGWRRGAVGNKHRYKTCSKEGCRKARTHGGLCDEHAGKAAAEGAAAAAG